MILGRAYSGPIKIKTDSPKGLRAVECGCCATCTCNPMCSITQIKITPAPPNWPSAFIIVNGVGDGGLFCDLFGWSYSTILSVTTDTTQEMSIFSSSYAGNGFKMGGTPYGTYSNGAVVSPV